MNQKDQETKRTHRGLYIIMVGLPARGKSTTARKLMENLRRDRIKVRVFNNGDLRRKLSKDNTVIAEFFHPDNVQGAALREKYALININQAKRFLDRGGQVAILDATNVSRKRRQMLEDVLDPHSIFYIECINNDEDILKANIDRKARHPEFASLSHEEAVESFRKRIFYYQQIYEPLAAERNFIRFDSFNRRILREEFSDVIPYYARMRDFLVTENIENLYLLRHPETIYNLVERIGGDPPLTMKGKRQVEDLARHFQHKRVPLIFTSTFQRTIETAQAIASLQEHCTIIPLKEFDEIHGGVCEEMTYHEILAMMPEVARARKKDKYNYVYPQGEGYATMEPRVERGIKKAFYLSENADTVMIVGHQAVNRMILSHFVYRRTEDVPYIYVPQNKYYHIVINQNKKLFNLKKF